MLSERVLDWALSHDLIDDPRIKELTHDLENQSNFAYWSSFMPNEILPIVRSTKASQIKQWYQRVVFLRNLLVFLPVTVTWIAISEASSSFSEFTSENSGSIVNFLQFWQDGYGYLAPIWRLSTIALIDFFILTTIMLLTASLPLMSSRIKSVEKREEKLYFQSREVLSKDLFEFFVNSQRVTPLTFSRTLANSLRNLSKSTQNLERLTKELRKVSLQLPNRNAILRDLNRVEKKLKRLSDYE